jgi:prepilin-type N-terminal cleavage/methylation domain-containing protein
MHGLPRLQKRAFTLIELLVVIAIIVLLISILVPSLRTAKRLARDAVCLANCQSITHSAMVYTGDWSNRLPINGIGGTTVIGNFDTRDTNCWADCLVWNKNASKSTFRCPADTLAQPTALPNRSAAQVAAAAKLSYGANMYMFGAGWPAGWSEKAPLLVERVEKPSRTIFMLDGTRWLPGVDGDSKVGLYSALCKGTFRHWETKSASYGFLDGHGEHITFLRMFGHPLDEVAATTPWDEMGTSLSGYTSASPWNITSAKWNYSPAPYLADAFPMWRPWPAKYAQVPVYTRAMQ